MASSRGPPRLWKPLQTGVFRQLLLASFVSDLGSFMQSVGAAWFMVSTRAGPFYVALIQTVSTLPLFLFGLLAGSLGDIVDRRKLILYTETWMLLVAVALAAAALLGWMSPRLMLALTFALSTGQAMESPTWRAVLPELVAEDALPAAAAWNGIEYNLALTMGPALAGMVIAAAGIGTAFLLNVASFLGVIVVVARWKRPVQRRRAVPAEALVGATVAAVRFVRYVPSVRTVIIRSAAVMFCASALFALLPTVASRASDSPIVYGFLLGAFGIGAIVGAFVMQAARARWSVDPIVTTAVPIIGAATIATGLSRSVAALAPVMLIAGCAFIVFFSLANALTQTLTPDWVRARVLAIFMLLTEGGLALGSLLWGAIASRVNVQTALVAAGLGTIATTGLLVVGKWPDTTADVRPWAHWRLPTVVDGAIPALEQGPVLVTVEYRVEAANAEPFLRAIEAYGRTRRRDGAFRWGIYRDIEQADVYLETFVVSSWAEHLRQHERFTLGDRELEERIAALARGEPRIRHLIHPNG